MTMFIEVKVERSSLGTEQAKAARRTVPTATAARLVARVEAQRRAAEICKPEAGG